MGWADAMLKKGATFVRDRPKIAEQFGKNAGLLFEISVKSNLLILLYEPGSDQGIGGVIQSRCNEIGLPNNLWLDVVNAVNGKASKDEVEERRVQNARRRRDLSQSAGPVMLGCL